VCRVLPGAARDQHLPLLGTGARGAGTGAALLGRWLHRAALLLAASGSLSQSQWGLHDFLVLLLLWPLPCCTLGICISQQVMSLVIMQEPVPWL